MFSKNKNKISVLLAGAELAPLVKVGGLGDVMGALPKALATTAKVQAIIPYYGSIKLPKSKVKKVKLGLRLELDGKYKKFDVYQTSLTGKIPVYLIKAPAFNAKEIYLGKRTYLKKGVYSRGLTDIERFVFFSKAVVETIKQLKLKLDIVHCHDWHTALIPTFIDEYNLEDKSFKNIKTLFTIHNLANQGIAGLDIIDYAALDKDLTPAVMEDYYDKDGDKIDLMKIGILSADLVNTVSPNYAKEILTKTYGEGLEEYLQRRKKHLFGIVNGIDTDLFNPTKDKYLKKKYQVNNFKTAHLINKKALQQAFKLAVKDVPVFGLVSRLVEQKGLDILLPALNRVLAKSEAQVVILGTGQKEYEEVCQKLAKKYPKQVKVKIGFNLALAQKIYGGSDFFLMPSKFEPCGLGQMIAMRYGCLPIVRSTGGLADTVKNNKTGLTFNLYQVKSLEKTLIKAIRLYANDKKMSKMIKLAMQQDWSWAKSAEKYLSLYNKLK